MKLNPIRIISLFVFLFFVENVCAQDSIPKITKNFVLGKYDQKNDARFVKVDSSYANKTIYLQQQVYQAYVQMYDQALKDGITLSIISGTRNFYAQKYIWERKWEKYNDLEPKERALKILKYSSMPSISRHHWGTDIDLVNLNNEFFNSGYGKKVYDWMKENAHLYGFYQVYTTKSNGRTGYNAEKWHWTYLPLSKEYLSYYNEYVTYKDINGFWGSELASEIDIITKYVNGVSEELKK